MWILECDGDLFQHKKTWLKPGHQYLFGRTKVDAGPGERSYAITHKTVSRKHLIISVSPVAPGRGVGKESIAQISFILISKQGEISSKSTLTITDESKLGTYLDGVKFVKESKVLIGHDHAITLGSFDQHFRLTWRPVVISFQFSDRQSRNIADALVPYRARFEQFDVKTIQPYIIGVTTHVVSAKRNTAKCLQALINGKYIVTEPFLDALEKAASSPGVAEDGITTLPSKLEQDFDGNWPNAIEYLPGPGREPVARAAELFAPNEQRINMFEGYTFIFADEAQFENLRPIVTNGGGKALKFDMKLGQTTLKEFVQYVRNVADKKGLEDLGHDSQGKGVVVVRFRGKGDTEKWATDFIRRMDEALEQWSIEQNEFLDPIVMVNAGMLLKPVQEEEMDGTRAPPSTAVTTRPFPSQIVQSITDIAENVVENSGAPPPPDPPKPLTSAVKLRARRQLTQSRFKGFDDFDLPETPKIHKRPTNSLIQEEDEGEKDDTVNRDSTIQGEHGFGTAADSQSLFVTDSQPSNRTAIAASQPLRKRPAPDSDEDDGIMTESAMVDALLPAAAAMKKRRLEDEAAGHFASFRENPADLASESASKQPKQKIPEKTEVDVRSVARLHAETLDAQRDEEQKQPQSGNGERNSFDESEVAKLRDLVIIEEMILPDRRKERVQQGSGDDHWDDQWNGRKNFKSFKKSRPGHDTGQITSTVNNHARKVIVALEEVKKKDYGIGDEYWLDPPVQTRDSSKSNGKQRRDATQTQTMSQSQQRHPTLQTDPPIDEITPFAKSSSHVRNSHAVGKRHQETDGTMRGVPKEAEPEIATVTTRGKRSAPITSPKDIPPSKRPRQTRLTASTRVANDEEDSSDDELKFRFRRKR